MLGNILYMFDYLTEMDIFFIGSGHFWALCIGSCLAVLYREGLENGALER